MATHKYDAKRRRALNMVWTACGDYKYEPEFLAYDTEGNPDLYLNSIIGFVHKWYDAQKIKDLFTMLNKEALGTILVDLTWLALENCAFNKEVQERPLLQNLRQEHARTYFKHSFDNAVQKFAAENNLVANLQAARWQKVLGKKASFANAWEKKLYTALTFPTEITTEDICANVKSICQEFFLCDFSNTKKSGKLKHLSLNQKLSSVLMKVLPNITLQDGDDLKLPSTLMQKQTPQRKRRSLTNKILHHENPQNYDFIRQCFGKPLYSEAESVRLETALCSGPHKYCHIYFTKGLADADGDGVPKLAAEASKQRSLNLAYYRKHEEIYRNSINLLKDKIKESMTTCLEPLPVSSRSGIFVPGQIWKSLYTNNSHVFTAKEEALLPNFTVDLMLDASTSRVGTQEIIAAQAYAISESLRLCGIPLQIYSFCSLKGYTVLHLLKNYQEEKKSTNIFSYFSTGWNRDGLAIRGARHLMGDFGTTKKILIILTDVFPNDDYVLPSTSKWKRSHAYVDAWAINDTAASVAALRREGIRVIGLINGEVARGLQAAHKIYGQDFARISDLDKMAEGVGSLLQKQIASLQ